VPGPETRSGTVPAVPAGVRIRLGSFRSLLDSPRLWALACRSPWLLSGEHLHLAGLHALSAGEHETAFRLFEGAARRYRGELRTEPLARVRVHQLMASACAAGGRMSPMSLEVDRALTRLERIESPEPPFELVPAHVLLASWLEGAEARCDAERLAA
jgi:hypothetical protein